MKVSFPWDRLEPGQGFFVPCVDTDKMRQQGLRAALHAKVRAEATVGIYGGQLGVWFSRYQPRKNVLDGRV